MRELLMNEIRYWNERQFGHVEGFYERRAPPGMKKFRVTPEWTEQYWSNLNDAEFVKQFTCFMLQHGKMR